MAYFGIGFVFHLFSPAPKASRSPPFYLHQKYVYCTYIRVTQITRVTARAIDK